MLNNAFPSMIWHLWDYDHTPGGSYFGVKAALCPGRLQCSHDDARAQLLVLPSSKRLVAVNHNMALPTPPVSARYSVFSLAGTQLASGHLAVPSLAPDNATAIGSVHAPLAAACRSAENGTLLLRLDVGGALSDNWMPCRPDVLNWTASTFYVTPCAAYADLRDLRCVCGRVPAQERRALT